MNLNPFKMLSPKMQKSLVGGLVGSLTYWADRAIADTQAWYPPQLKQKLAPQLPRNDELITTVAPPVVMYFLAKKNPTKFGEMAMGTVMFSGPQLLDRLVVNAVTPPTVTMPFRVATATARPLPVTPTQVARPAMAQVGKYR